MEIERILFLKLVNMFTRGQWEKRNCVDYVIDSFDKENLQWKWSWRNIWWMEKSEIAFLNELFMLKIHWSTFISHTLAKTTTLCTSLRFVFTWLWEKHESKTALPVFEAVLVLTKCENKNPRRKKESIAAIAESVKKTML